MIPKIVPTAQLPTPTAVIGHGKGDTATVGVGLTVALNRWKFNPLVVQHVPASTKFPPAFRVVIVIKVRP